MNKLITDFLLAIVVLSIRWNFSVTSWIRSTTRNIIVGGHRDSYHMLGLAVDIVLDDMKEDRDGFKMDCERLGLECVDEGDHFHVEFKD